MRTNPAEYLNEVTAKFSVVDSEMETVADQSAVRVVKFRCWSSKKCFFFGYHSNPEFSKGTSTEPIFSTCLGLGAPPFASTTAYHEAIPSTTVTVVSCVVPGSITVLEKTEEYLEIMNTGAMMLRWYSSQQYHRFQNPVILRDKTLCKFT